MSNAVSDLVVVCTVVSAVVSLVTLLTVYVAAVQILNQRRIYRLGLSLTSLGNWRKKVVSHSFYRLQTIITTPRVSLPVLVQKNQGEKWTFCITFPRGFRGPAHSSKEDEEAGLLCDQGLPETSWVNFLEAIHIDPNDKKIYQTRYEPDLVNGIVPMRWKGKDLVGICCVLGFQSFEDKPSTKEPMRLPMQWSGPIGWIQFRESTDGCIAEYRRRVYIEPQLSNKDLDKDALSYFQDLGQTCSRPLGLEARLWQAISGLNLKGNRVLYLGGTDGFAEKRLARRQARQTADSDEVSNQGRDKDLSDDEIPVKGRTATLEEVSDEKTEMDISNDETLPAIRETWQKGDDETDEDSPEDEMQSLIRGRAFNLSEAFSELNRTGSFMRKLMGRGKSVIAGNPDDHSVPDKVEVFTECPGLLSVIAQGEQANSWGLDLRQCIEYDRVYLERGEWERSYKSTHEYCIGTLRMDKDLLKLIKEAVMELRPDGYFYTPTPHLCSDVNQFFRHVKKQSNDLNDDPDRSAQLNYIIFPFSEVEDWSDDKPLYYAMALCNDFQRIKRMAQACFTVEDMLIVSKASESLRKLLNKQFHLIWAFIVSPELFCEMAERFGKMTRKEMDNIKISSQDETISLSGYSKDPAVPRREFQAPLMEDGQFSGLQVLAAFVDVFLTYFWISKGCQSDVGAYASTIPQSVTMC